MKLTSAETGAVNSWLGLGYFIKCDVEGIGEKYRISLLDTPVNANLASHLTFLRSVFRHRDSKFISA